jgi:uncharacterized oxidoreductase
MCEVLGGALTGNGCATLERPIANGMFSLYVDPARVDPEGVFPDEVLRYVAYVKRAKAAQPGGETLVPGEPEQRTRARRLADGIPLVDETWASLIETARPLGVDLTSIEFASTAR